MPHVLVATVGLNPLPVALAILTTRAEYVVLVHSTGSEAEAEAIRDVVARAVRSACGPYGRPRHENDALVPMPRFAESECCGAAEKFAPTLEYFQGLSRRLRNGDLIVRDDAPEHVGADGTPAKEGKARPSRKIPPSTEYLLDYSGGNKIMTVSAVTAHLEDHDDGADAGARLRSYVDPDTGYLVTGSNARGAGALPVDSTGLRLRDIAQMHGFWIRHTARGPIKLSPTEIENLIEDLIQLLDRADRNGTASGVATEAECRLAALAGQLGLPEPEWVTKPAGKPHLVRGKLREILAWAVVSRCVREHNLTTLEVLFSVKVKLAGSDFAEFDLVLRHEHRVLAIEVKSSVPEAYQSLGRRSVHARAVFGSATVVGMISARGIGNQGWDQLVAAVQILTDRAPWLGRIEPWQLDVSAGHAQVGTGILKWLNESAGDRSQAVDALEPIDQAVLIPFNGVRLAVAVSIAEAAHHGGRRVVGVGVRSAELEAQLRGYARKVDLPAEIRRSAGFSEWEGWEAVELVDVTDAMVTPGPKGITAALVRRARESAARVQHVGLDGRRHEVRFTDERVAHCAQPEPVRARPAWTDFLSPRYTLDRPRRVDERIHLVADHLLDGLDDADIQLWWPAPRSAAELALDQSLAPEHTREHDDIPSPPTALLSGEPLQQRTLHALRAGLLLTGRWGCCSVHVLGLPATADEEIIRKVVSRFRTSVLNQAADVVNLVGAAHRALIVLHDRAGSTPLERCLTAPGLDIDKAWPRWRDTNGWLPFGLWSPSAAAGDGSAAVRVELDAVRTHLHGRTHTR